jgi:hypothetical protein
VAAPLEIDVAGTAGVTGGDAGGNWIARIYAFRQRLSDLSRGYAYALYAHLPGSRAIRGTIWGLVLWLVAQTVVMPMMGAGLFSSAMGGAMGSLIGLVYA